MVITEIFKFSLHRVFTYKTIKSCIIANLFKLTPLMVVIYTSGYTQGVHTYLPLILVNYRNVCGGYITFTKLTLLKTLLHTGGTCICLYDWHAMIWYTVIKCLIV